MASGGGHPGDLGPAVFDHEEVTAALAFGEDRLAGIVASYARLGGDCGQFRGR